MRKMPFYTDVWQTKRIDRHSTAWFDLYGYMKVQYRRLFASFRSIKHRVVIILKTLKAVLQLVKALEKLIRETENAKEEIINMKVRTSQLYTSFNYLYANMHEISKETGILVPELDMNSLPTRQMLNL